ncbi:YceI family protein [Streptomyces sp. NPDC047853]|uniref:YceI family protein n=1 Tax=unclassified Streptomyces TaxID=2593676 RepID=UPI003456C345
MFLHRHRAALHSTDSYAAATGVYTIDPTHSTIGFSVRHAALSDVHGTFDRFEGLLKLDGSAPVRSEAYLSVQTDSLDTAVQERDARLRGPGFLDSATYPLMVFGSTRTVSLGGGAFRLAGTLRVKDLELPLDVDVVFGGVGEDAQEQHRVHFSASAVLRRWDWGLNRSTAPDASGVLDGDGMTLTLDVSAVRVDHDAAA